MTADMKRCWDEDAKPSSYSGFPPRKMLKIRHQEEKQDTEHRRETDLSSVDSIISGGAHLRKPWECRGGSIQFRQEPEAHTANMRLPNSSCVPRIDMRPYHSQDASVSRKLIERVDLNTTRDYLSLRNYCPVSVIAANALAPLLENDRASNVYEANERKISFNKIPGFIEDPIGQPWTREEHANFLQGVAKYGNQWNYIAATFVPTRSPLQVRSYGRKYFCSTAKQNGLAEHSDCIDDNGVPKNSVIGVPRRNAWFDEYHLRLPEIYDTNKTLSKSNNGMAQIRSGILRRSPEERFLRTNDNQLPLSIARNEPAISDATQHNKHEIHRAAMKYGKHDPFCLDEEYSKLLECHKKYRENWVEKLANEFIPSKNTSQVSCYPINSLPRLTESPNYKRVDTHNHNPRRETNECDEIDEESINSKDIPLPEVKTSPSVTAKKGSVWTEEEHQQFLEGHKKYGNQWKKIALEFVKTRTPNQVVHHAREHFAPKNSSNTGVWSDLEHLQFLRGYQKYGKLWKQIAIDFVPTRTPTQVVHHARDYFSPRGEWPLREQFSIDLQKLGDLIRRERWSFSEHLSVLKAYRKYGRKWTKLCEEFVPSRTPLQVFNYVHYFLTVHGCLEGNYEKLYK